MSSDQDRDQAAPSTRRTATAERATRGRLDAVPAPRPASDLDALPAVPRRSRRGMRGAVAVVAVVALAGTGLVVGQVHHRHVEAVARAEADRVSASHAAAGANVRLTAYAGADLALHDRAVTAAKAAVGHAVATLAAAPDADPALRDALTTAESRLNGLLGGSDALTTALTAAAAELQAADQRVAESEAAWQAAAAAAAAQAAAEQAAAQAAAQQAAAAQAAAAQAAHAKTVTKAPARTTTRSTTTTAPPASTSTGTLPAGALRCTAAGSGASVASASALGAAINSYRSAHGLPTLSVVTSGTLTHHALDMANAGGIWHSGNDNIVGCVSNGSYSYLVQAWDGSAPHRAQMQRTGISTMSVGVATLGGWLYGAVFFS